VTRWEILHAALTAHGLGVTEAGVPRNTFTCRELAAVRVVGLGDVDSLDGVEVLTGLERLGAGRIERDGLAPLAASCPLRGLDIGPRYSSTRPTSVADLTPLRGCEHLEVLAIRGAQVRDLAPISGLVYLREIDLPSNEIDEIAALRPLVHLEKLNLAYNRVRDLAPLRDLSRLVVLDLTNNRVDDLEALADLAALRELDLRYNPVEALEPLQRLTALETLLLNRTGVRDLRPLERLHRLRMLSICLTPAESGDTWKNVNRGVVETLRRRGVMVITREACRH